MHDVVLVARRVKFIKKRKLKTFDYDYDVMKPLFMTFKPRWQIIMPSFTFYAQ